LTAHAVLFSLLANNESVDLATESCSLMHDGSANRVGTHCETARGFEIGYAGIVEHVEHYLADERRGLVVQSGSAQVNVVVGLDATRESDPAVNYRKFFDEFYETRVLG
jgi:hypothetical protein